MQKRLVAQMAELLEQANFTRVDPAERALHPHQGLGTTGSTCRSTSPPSRRS